MFARLILLNVCMMLGFLSVTGVQAQEELRKSIYFEGGSYEIDPHQAGILLDWLDSIPNLLEKYEIELISHTDPIGGKRYNAWLSSMRSSGVRQLLLNHSIPDKLMHIRDWAFDRPVYSNQDGRGMRLNRRVDVIVRPMVF